MTQEKHALPVALRTTMGKANKRLLKEGLLPGNISGHNLAPQAVQVEAAAFEALRRNRAATGVIRLTMPNAPVQTVLIRHVQRGPRSGKIIHIDFTRVGMDERVSAKVPLRFVGESPSVKNQGGVLLHLLDTLDIECPASDIAEYLEVDISSLTEIDATLSAKDVALPAQFTLITPADEPIAKVAATRAAITSEAAAAPTEAATPETKA